jgi:putative ubiquitin-RnfH superfamily antitoxin RatB of RatAB toxin-antitoxin module
MRVEVAYADAAQEILVALDVEDGCRVDEAVRRSGVLARVAAPRATLAFAIFGRRVDPAASLAPDDRVEVTRPLVCDAKTARRLRAARDGPGRAK